MRYYRTSAKYALIRSCIAAVALTACGSDVRVPPPPDADAAKAEEQKRAFIEALKPRRPGRPLIAIAAYNEGTEITEDYIYDLHLRALRA